MITHDEMQDEWAGRQLGLYNLM